MNVKTVNSSSLAPNSVRSSALPPVETQKRILYYLKLTRELEDRIERKLYRQGKILGGVYVGRGQEAIAVGSCVDLRPDDVVCPSHRDMGAYLLRGLDLRTILAQYLGRKTGPTKGKDGNLHFGSLKHNVIAFISMLGDSVPVAAGIGMSFKMRGEDRVVVCPFGDGSTSRGDWHEGTNMASVFKAPVIYLCNNNQYAYSTPLERQMNVENVADRAVAYGIPGEIVDGNDVLAVWEASQRAIKRARAGEGPTLIECKTFRMTGHSAHDDADYVPQELFEQWEERDPIRRLERDLIARGIMTAAAIEEMQKGINAEIDAALAQAESDPYPDPEDCITGVYDGE